MMHNANVPLAHIQEISGHHDLGTLRRYLEVSDEQKKGRCDENWVLDCAISQGYTLQVWMREKSLRCLVERSLRRLSNTLFI